MLTVKAPIELKCTDLMIPSGEDFYKRITGNYGMITSGITEEELLHVVTTPPEIYLAGEGETGILNTTNISNRQETRIDVINNLVNRILVSEDVGFTYQDRVYITNILHKMGIRNEQLFMNQVAHIREEASNTTKLVNMYWDYVADLQEMLSEYKSSMTVQKEGDQSTEEDRSVYLHEEIMNRLQTASIYQEMNNFHRNALNLTEITDTELLLSDQSRLTQNILLQELKNVARSEDRPLVYRHENYYEEQELTEENVTEENVTRQMTSAVLLNLIDNVLQTRLSTTNRFGDRYYHIEHALFGTAENTLNRLRMNLTSEFRSDTHAGDTIIRQNRVSQEEIRLLNQLFEGGKTTTITNLNHLLTESPDEVPVSEKVSAEISRQVTNLLDEHRNVTELNLENIRNESDERYLTEQNTDLLQQQLQMINRHNLKMREQYLERVRQIQEKSAKSAPGATPEERRRAAFLALTHPDEFMKSRAASAQKDDGRPDTQVNAYREALPEDAKQIINILQQYIEAPEKLRDTYHISKDNMGMLLSDIRQVERTHRMTEHDETELSGEVRKITERVASHYNEKVMPAKAKRIIRNEVAENVEMIHKAQNEISQEELLETMMEQSKILQKRREVNEQTIETKTVENKTITNTVDRQITERTEDITEMIRQGVRQQMGTISDQVFRKLEKKMESEKRRRGL
ncbi:MAG: hypothetical protein E7300_02275 [Lachnospiraceae bacterium]|nr:hypothetical protein [Lachnospiraceae bacterium]